MYREWNVFGRLRQALVHIQTTNALGRRPRPYSTYSQPFRPGREIEKRPCKLACTLYKSSLQQLEHSAQENANPKHSVSPGAYHCSGPRTNGRFGANYEWRRLHSTQGRKRHEIFRKPRSLNGEHFHSSRVSHLLLWDDLHFCHSCYSL